MKNPLKAKLKAGEPAVGIWVGISHPDITEIIAMMGFDWFVCDTEHSPYDIETSQKMLQAASYNPDCIPLIRVARNSDWMIKKALDTGAYGIIIPWVNTREEAEYAVQSSLYPPKGIRGCGPRRAALHDSEYIKTANDEILIGVQIETQLALDNLDDILSVDRIDVCFIGPNDLSLSLGIHQQFDHPKFTGALEQVLKSCKQHDVAPGMYCTTKTINRALEQGFQFCVLWSDQFLFIKGMKDAINDVKGWTPTPYKT